MLVLPPASLTECSAEPLAPELPSREYQNERDNLTLAYVLALRSAWGDCKSKTEGLRAWMDAAGE